LPKVIPAFGNADETETALFNDVDQAIRHAFHTLPKDCGFLSHARFGFTEVLSVPALLLGNIKRHHIAAASSPGDPVVIVELPGKIVLWTSIPPPPPPPAPSAVIELVKRKRDWEAAAYRKEKPVNEGARSNLHYPQYGEKTRPIRTGTIDSNDIMIPAAVSFNLDAFHEEKREIIWRRGEIQGEQNCGKKENMGMEEMEKPGEERLHTGGIDTAHIQCVLQEVCL
jgi:hypothetical protein